MLLMTISLQRQRKKVETKDNKSGKSSKGSDSESSGDEKKKRKTDLSDVLGTAVASADKAKDKDKDKASSDSDMEKSGSDAAKDKKEDKGKALGVKGFAVGKDDKKTAQAKVPQPPPQLLTNDGNFLSRFRMMYGDAGDETSKGKVSSGFTKAEPPVPPPPVGESAPPAKAPAGDKLSQFSQTIKAGYGSGATATPPPGGAPVGAPRPVPQMPRPFWHPQKTATPAKAEG